MLPQWFLSSLSPGLTIWRAGNALALAPSQGILATRRRAIGSSRVSTSPEVPVSLAHLGSSEVLSLVTEPYGPMAKSRRVRGRKPLRPITEPAVTSAAATWVQVGPGKFVRAHSQDQGLITASEPEPLIEAMKDPTRVGGSPPDSLERVFSTTDLSLANTSAEATLVGTEPSSNLDVPFPESAKVTDPQQVLLPLNRLDQNASSATDEYGIAPSVFSSDLWEAALEGTNRERDETGSSISPHHVAEAENQAGIELIASMAQGSSRTGNPKATPGAVSCELPLARTSSEGNSQTHDGISSTFSRTLLKLRPRFQNVPGIFLRSRMSRYLWNAHSRLGCWTVTRLQNVASHHTRTLARRNFGRSHQTHHGFLPRSPPLRS